METPDATYFDFLKLYRQLTRLQMGGTKPVRKYHSITIEKVCSVGEQDHYNNLPFRVSTSNFSLGPSIISYGCILRHVSGKYLLLKRSSTIEYLDLLRGNYRVSHLYFLCIALSEEERTRLLTQDFETCWNQLFGRVVKNEIYQMAEEKFLHIRPHLETIFTRFPSVDPQGKGCWIFPKGRLDYIYSMRKTPSLYCPPSGHLASPTGTFELEANISSETTKFLGQMAESPLSCALREFTEETNGLTIDKDKALFAHPIVESYMGTNNKNYTTRFFIFGTEELIDLPVPDQRDSFEELRWVQYEDLESYLIPRRLEIIKTVEETLGTYTSIDNKWTVLG